MAATNNHILNFMLKQKTDIPLTREKYLEFAYFGNPPEEIDGELLAELDEFDQAVEALKYGIRPPADESSQ
jgi:hypothetical protein